MESKVWGRGNLALIWFVLEKNFENFSCTFWIFDISMLIQGQETIRWKSRKSMFWNKCSKKTAVPSETVWKVKILKFQVAKNTFFTFSYNIPLWKSAFEQAKRSDIWKVQVNEHVHFSDMLFQTYFGSKSIWPRKILREKKLTRSLVGTPDQPVLMEVVETAEKSVKIGVKPD